MSGTFRKFSDRVDIITSDKPRRRGEVFLKLDGKFSVKVYKENEDAMALAERIAMFLTVMDGPAWETAWQPAKPMKTEVQGTWKDIE